MKNSKRLCGDHGYIKVPKRDDYQETPKIDPKVEGEPKG